jgi:hypothetical protein
MYLCSSCLISLSYKERVIRCAGKGCSNNPERQGQIRPLFYLPNTLEIERGREVANYVRELVSGFLREIKGVCLRTLVISSRRDLEEKILTAIICPITEVSKLTASLEKNCLECLAAEKIGWRTFLCQSCGKTDELEDVKNAFKKSLDLKGSPTAERMAVVFTIALLSLIEGENPFREEVIVNGDSLARIGLFGERTSTF